MSSNELFETNYLIEYDVMILVFLDKYQFILYQYQFHAQE